MGALTGMDIERMKEMFDEPRSILTGIPIGEYKYIDTIPISSYNPMAIQNLVGGVILLKINGTGIIHQIIAQAYEHGANTILEIQIIVDGEIAFSSKTKQHNIHNASSVAITVQCESPGINTNGSNYYFPYTFLFKKSIEIKLRYVEGVKDGTAKVGVGARVWYKEKGGQL